MEQLKQEPWPRRRFKAPTRRRSIREWRSEACAAEQTEGGRRFQRRELVVEDIYRTDVYLIEAAAVAA